MREIQLTLGMVATVDDADYEFLNQWNWRVEKNYKTYYAVRYTGKKRIPMHRVLLNLSDPKVFADHKDRNGLNNQRSNLRLATHSQNMANRGSFKNSTSKFMGVSWCKRSKKWRAVIKEGVTKHIGFFENESDAALAYNKEASRIYGEFASINNIQSHQQ